MGQLTNLYVSSSFQGLLKMTDSTQGLTNTLQTIQTGDGDNSPLQMSLTEVNISGSFYINNVPITNGTNGTSGTSGTSGSNGSSGSSGTSGSNGTNGSSGTSGSNGTNGSSGSSGSNGTNGSSGTSGSNGTNGTSGVAGSSGTSGTSPIFDSGSYATTGSNQFIGNQAISGSLTLTGPIIGSTSLVLQPDANDVRFVEIYNTSPTDTHITASGGQIFLGDDVTYVKVDNYGSVERIDIVAGNELVVSSSVINLSGSLHQSGTFYPDQIDFINSSIQLGTGSYVLTTNTSGVTQYDTYQNVASALQPFINTGSFSKDGLITTGSIVDTQQITGSLILGNTVISGSLIGNTVNGGLIKIQSESNRSGSVQFNITGSSPISQSNLVFGGFGTNGPTLTGSIIISGSNNIILSGSRTNTVGTIGYIGGNMNIVNTIPQLNAASLFSPSMNNNQLNSALSMSFTTSSLGVPNISNNLIFGATTINHPSGSISATNNLITVNSITSTQNVTTGTVLPTLSNNIMTGTAVSLNHISSSILTTANALFGTLFVNNSYFQTGSANSLTVSNNLISGLNINVNAGGSPQTNVSRPIVGNLIGGQVITISAAVTGSDLGGLRNTVVYGYNLNVTGSHSAAQTTTQGAAFLGRWNSEDAGLADSARTVFAVGTGTATGASRKTALYITSGSIVGVSGSLLVQGPSTMSGSLSVTGDVMFSSGSNKTMGTVVLNGGNPGVATVSNSLVTTSSLIFLTKQTNTNSGNGTVSVTSKGSGTFSITSDHNGDTDVVAYQIINPA